MAAGITTVVQLSDTHIGRTPSTEPRSPDTQLQAAVTAARAMQPDVVLLTGDIADDGSPEAYERVERMTADLAPCVLATPGNHDDASVMAGVFGKTLEVAVGGWRVLTVDTSIPGEIAGHVDLDSLLQRLGPPNETPLLLALHHPPMSPSRHPWFQLDGGGELIAALSRRGDVNIVTAGHLHQPFRAVVEGVTYFGCSSTWYSLAHRDIEFEHDDGHTGGLAFQLFVDGSWTWRRFTGTAQAASPAQS